MKKFSVFFLLIILVSCGKTQEIENEKLKIPTIPKTNNVKEIKQILSKDTNEAGKIKVYVDYPVFTNEKTSRYIKNYISKFIENSKERFKKNKKDLIGENDFHEIHTSFNEFSGNDMKSIYYEIYEYFGGPHGTIYTKIFNLDKSGSILKTGDIFDFNNENKDKFKKIILSKLKEKNIFKEDFIINKGFETFFNDIKFYKEKNNFIFIFDQYLLAPHSAGIIKVELKTQEVNIFLKDDFKNNEINGEKINEEKTATPKENISKKENNISESIDKEKKYIALTFDDGPNKKNTPILLDILRKNNVKATFYVLGKNVNYFPEILKKEFEEGHEIGNHSWDHPRLTRLKDDKLKEQIEKTDNKIFEIIGEKPKTFRPPYGVYDDKVKSAINRTMVMRNVDPIDRKTRNVKSNIRLVLKNTKTGSIVLLHDIHKSSVDSVDAIIKKLKEKNYEFVTVSELLRIYQDGNDYEKKVCSSGFSCK